MSQQPVRQLLVVVPQPSHALLVEFHSGEQALCKFTGGGLINEEVGSK
jgi:hypothetical protein